MKTLIKYFALVIYLAVIFIPFNSLGAKTIFYSGTNLTPEETEFLISAYKDECRDKYFFKKAYEKFPDASAFAKIMNSEQNHMSALESVFNKYDIETPKNLDFSDIVMPSNSDEACALGLKYEKENVEMYKKFLLSVTNNFLKTVFEDLRDITINRNIPALEKCK
jgi:hypothetical protein